MGSSSAFICNISSCIHGFVSCGVIFLFHQLCVKRSSLIITLICREKGKHLHMAQCPLIYTTLFYFFLNLCIKNMGSLQKHEGSINYKACNYLFFHRFLIHRRFFKQTLTSQKSPVSYTQTPLSKLLIKNGGNSMAALVLLESTPVMLAPWQKLSSRALENGAPPFEAEHGVDIWGYASANPAHSKLIDDGMSCIAKMSMAAIIGQYPAAFAGIGSLVDVGGGDGSTLRSVVREFPWIQGINFDLPHVVSVAPRCDGIEHVAGNMFDKIPQADAAFLMSVLHDWSDEECIQILKKCREGIPCDKGKVIIVEAVIVEGDEDKYSNVRLALDMVMLAHTEKGKERTFEEWEYVVKEAGFTRVTVKSIEAIVSIIEAYP